MAGNLENPIPDQLREKNFRFVKVRGKDERFSTVSRNGKTETLKDWWKIPVEIGWQSASNYTWDSPEIQKWIAEGGNYGVACGFGGLVVLDQDHCLLAGHIQGARLPPTFTSKTPSGGKHYYYRIEGETQYTDYQSGPLIAPLEGPMGEIKSAGTQVVGPNSCHPDGSWYMVDNDADIQEISPALFDRLRYLVTGRGQKDPQALRFVIDGKDTVADDAAELFLREYNYNVITHRVTEDVYHFDGQVYRRMVENKITDFIYNAYSKKHTEFVREALARVRAKTHREEEEFDADTGRVALLNGVYNITTGALEDYDPEIILTIQIPVEYRAGAASEKWLKFLGEVVRPEDVPVLQEFAGYCLYRAHPFKRWLMLVGGGDNGKTVFINVLSALLGGNENVTNISLQELQTGRFTKACLYRKLANFHPDIKKLALKDTDVIKTLTGGEKAVNGENKFQKMFMFANHAKLIFACNEPPLVFDESDAFYQRMIVIMFPNQFVEGRNADARLSEKLTAPEELTGVLNWAFEGLRRLLKNEKFTTRRTAEENRAFYRRLSDPLWAFVTECVEIAPGEGAEVSKDVFYQQFVEFCALKKLPPTAKIDVGRHLPKVVPSVGDRIARDGSGGNVRVWTGVRLRRPTEDPKDDTQRVIEKYDELDGGGGPSWLEGV